MRIEAGCPPQACHGLDILSLEGSIGLACLLGAL